MKYFRLAAYLVVLFGFCNSFAGAYEDFFQATKTDNLSVVRALLSRGFDPNAVDESGQPALTRALRDGAQKISDELLAHPALKVDQVNLAGETPLMMAALKGQAAQVRRLLERGAAVNRSGWSPLHYAATGPDPAIVKLLIERGAAVDARSPNGTTPLMMAAQYGSEDSVQLLLAHRAERGLRNDLGLSAGDFARKIGRDRLAAQLDTPAR